MSTAHVATVRTKEQERRRAEYLRRKARGVVKKAPKLTREQLDKHNEYQRAKYARLSQDPVWHMGHKDRVKINRETKTGRYATYKSSAKVRGHVFEIDFEFFCMLLEDRCFYCKETAGGVDRYDNAIGYTRANCVPCCSQCNYEKARGDAEKYIEYRKKKYPSSETPSSSVEGALQVVLEDR
jgi:hypothetical protein